MGILNVTPDSFSDGGELQDLETVVSVGRRMREEGAAVLDVGGESTRPGAEEVPLDEELRRVIPAVKALVERVGLPVSVDTRKSAVFLEAYAAGASMLNDPSGLSRDPGMPRALARTEAAAIVMHSRGTPGTMDGLADYNNLVAEVIAELERKVGRILEAGVPRGLLYADPGLGFAKDAAQSWELIRRIGEMHALGLPLVVGPSRKRFLGTATGRFDPRSRDTATAAVVVHLARQSVAMVRVHDVGGAMDAVRIASALGRTDVPVHAGGGP
jgi:dihydropteroate synthase